MNCDEFSQRMHQCLDHRESVDGDDDLCRHARQCESCRAQLDAWRQIAAVIPAGVLAAPSEPDDRSGTGKVVAAAASLAAAILLAVIVGRHDWKSDAPVAVDRGYQSQESVLAQESVLSQSSHQLDPSLWWRSVQDRDWVGQTMPTVKSVQAGVAPIGRSLMRAVTILTIGGSDRTS